MLFNEFLSAHWQKMNTSPVCFGAKNNKFGKFRAPYGGKLAAVKMVYLHGLRHLRRKFANPSVVLLGLR